MSNLYGLSEAQMERLRRYFTKSHGVAPVEDWRALGGIVFFNRSGSRWRDALRVYGPHKRL